MSTFKRIASEIRNARDPLLGPTARKCLMLRPLMFIAAIPCIPTITIGLIRITIEALIVPAFLTVEKCLEVLCKPSWYLASKHTALYVEASELRESADK